MRVGTGLILIMALVAGAPVHAYDYDMEYWEFSPFIGALFAGGFEDTINDYDWAYVEQDNSFMTGVRAAYFIHSHIGFEATWAYSRTSFYVDEDGGFFEDKETKLTDVDLYTVSGAFVIGFLHGDFVPFMDFGAGVNLYDMDNDNLDSRARWFFDVGGGLRAYLSETVGVRFDLRSYYTYMYWYDEGTYRYNDYEILPSLEMSAGLMLRFR
ncbi:outer membrane beta-barrel protein [bacterium]|nr:outer membrane beta-barrel protein [candidate division CSSED10-310 bacterium]